MERSIRYFLVLCLLTGLAIPIHGQVSLQKIFQPDAVGASFNATHLDGLAESMSAGPGIELFLKYNLSPRLFLTAGTGISLVYDDVLTTQNFKQTLLPNFDIKLGYNLIPGSKFTPFVFFGLHGFGSTVSVLGFTSDRVWDASVFGGGGLAYAVNPQWSLFVSGDYRYIFTSDVEPKSKYWVARAGVEYALVPKDEGPREEMEYPTLDDQDDVALDDLFREVDQGEVSEEDALALLFQTQEDTDVLTSEEMSEADIRDALLDVTETPDVTYTGDPEVDDLLMRIQDLRNEMVQRMRVIDDLQAKIEANERAIASVASSVAGASIPGSFGVNNALSFKQNYEDGLQEFYNKQFQNAIRIFSGLLVADPDHRLASNCQYWIGESYNAMGDYRKAIDAFNSVMRYRTSYKFDDALLMSGLCHLKLGDRDTARENFQLLVSRYPDSEYAPKAMRYLGRL